MTGAERQRLYMERIKARAPVSDADEVAELRRKLADALSEVARLNKEGDRLAIENDSLKRRLKAKESRESDLCKRLDAATAERDQARAANVQAEGDLALSRH
jgi:regulator of replication initiation timing